MYIYIYTYRERERLCVNKSYVYLWRALRDGMVDSRHFLPFRPSPLCLRWISPKLSMFHPITLALKRTDVGVTLFPSPPCPKSYTRNRTV